MNLLCTFSSRAQENQSSILILLFFFFIIFTYWNYNFLKKTLEQKIKPQKHTFCFCLQFQNMFACDFFFCANLPWDISNFQKYCWKKSFQKYCWKMTLRCQRICRIVRGLWFWGTKRPPSSYLVHQFESTRCVSFPSPLFDCQTKIKYTQEHLLYLLIDYLVNFF